MSFLGTTPATGGTPTEKAGSGIRPLIEAFSPPGAIVLDGEKLRPVATSRLSLSRQYCDIARDRLLKSARKNPAA